MAYGIVNVGNNASNSMAYLTQRLQGYEEDDDISNILYTAVKNNFNLIS